MSSSNNEEKVQDASLMEEKVSEPIENIPEIEPVPLDQAAAADQAAAEIEADIAEMFSSDEQEELLDAIPVLSPSAANLERALTEEVVFGDNEEEESLACAVCYTALDKDNIVNTPCNHTYCWECFFKWVTNAPTCPMCRRNFVSENAWYQNRDVEQDRNNTRELINIYQRELVSLSNDFRGINNSIKCAEIKLAKVKYENGENIRRLISSREQISYNEGFISGQKDVNNNMFSSKFMKQQSNSNSPWFQGYSKAQWELRFTNRVTSGSSVHIPKSISELNDSEVDEYNKHSMGFKIETTNGKINISKKTEIDEKTQERLVVEEEKVF